MNITSSSPRVPFNDSFSPSVAIIGMGYVGAVTAAALGDRGCQVIGVEISPVKLEQLRQGESPVREPGIDEVMLRLAQNGKLTATDSIAEAVEQAEVIMTCVGTPSASNGQVDLGAIERVTQALADALENVDEPRTVLIRSTVPPGTTSSLIRPLLTANNAQVSVAHHPEFLREGTALKDFQAPPMIIWGCEEQDKLAVESIMHRLYQGIEAPRRSLGTVESELMKYACNVFHAVKIDFANEFGSLAESLGADPLAVMDAFCLDEKLNLSRRYLRPGFAFGGSCLPKDTRATCGLAMQQGLQLPLITSVNESNRHHLERGVHRVLSHGRGPTLMVGLSFKQGTDDLRESPNVELAERLIGKGVQLSIFDPDLCPNRLIGANAQYIAQRLPHLKLLLTDHLESSVQSAKVIVVAKAIDGLSDILTKTDAAVIDLTGSQLDRPAATSQRLAG